MMRLLTAFLTILMPLLTGPYPESLHPYADSTNDLQTYTAPGGTTSVDVTFDAQTKVESGFDFIYVQDGAGTNITGSPFTGTSLAGLTKTVTGNIVKIRLTSDSSVDYWGYATTMSHGLTIISSSIDVPYLLSSSAVLQAIGGSGSLTWSIISGTLPPGISLNASTGALTGTATTVGIYSVQFSVTDGGQTDAVSVLISVGMQGSAAVIDTLGHYPVGYYSATSGSGAQAQGVIYGPWEYGGAIYVLTPSYFDSKVHVLKSVDLGSTWTAQNPANAPPFYSGGSDQPCGTFDEDHTITALVRDPDSGDLYLHDLDMRVGGGWSVPYGVLAGAAMRDNSTAQIASRSPGEFILFGLYSTFTVDQVVWLEFVGGSWSSVTAVSALGTPSDPPGAWSLYLDGTGVAHLLYYGLNSTNTYGYTTIQPGNSMTGAQTFSLTGGLRFPNFRSMAVYAGKVYIFHLAGSLRDIVVDIGSPSSSPTTWTSQTIVTTTDAINDFSPYVESDGSALSLLYSTVSDPGFIYQAHTADGSTWVSDGVFHQRPAGFPTAAHLSANGNAHSDGVFFVSENSSGSFNIKTLYYAWKVVPAVSPIPPSTPKYYVDGVVPLDIGLYGY